MKAYLTRRYMFSASHRLHSDAMSDAENVATYGKCNNPYGHGHNYALEVTVSGPVDAEHRHGLQSDGSGWLCARRNSGALRSSEPEYAGRNLRATVPTTENLCIVIYDILQRGFRHAHLEKVRFEETMMNSFEYWGENRVIE